MASLSPNIVVVDQDMDVLIVLRLLPEKKKQIYSLKPNIGDLTTRLSETQTQKNMAGNFV